MTTITHAAHTAAFFQTAFTIVLALALGQALGQFVSSGDDRPLHWDRLPSFAAFILILFPFFQGMGRHMFTVYLDPATAPPYQPSWLMFDGIVFLIQAAIIYAIAHAIPPQRWRRFYGAVLLLLAVDIAWAGVTMWRGIHVGFWVVLDAGLAAVLLGVLWWERGSKETLRPAIICATALAISTALSYLVMTDFYVSR